MIECVGDPAGRLKSLERIYREVVSRAFSLLEVCLETQNHK